MIKAHTHRGLFFDGNTLSKPAIQHMVKSACMALLSDKFVDLMTQLGHHQKSEDRSDS